MRLFYLRISCFLTELVEQIIKIFASQQTWKKIRIWINRKTKNMWKIYREYNSHAVVVTVLQLVLAVGASVDIKKEIE